MNLMGKRQGFALMGVLVAVAVIAILAAVLGPLAYRQLMQSRERSTLQEMNALEDGLLAFFNDTGRFPRDAEGLAALAVDPGLPGWQGPYLIGERYVPVDELTSDAFGRKYIYDLDPVTNPPGTTDLILVSGGVNRSVSIGQVDGIWALGSEDDDLVVLVNSGANNRDKTVEARDEMQAIGEAAQKFFQDNANFPADSADLDAAYLDGSFSGDAFVDPWLNSYIMEVDSGLDPPVMTLRSRGPNLVDDGGAGDDITLDVGSVQPGRKSTYYMIRIAQAVVNSKSGTNLTGNWSTDRHSLELTEAFEVDGWGNPYDMALSTRTVVSAGPDADYFTPEDNIPPGVVPDDNAPETSDIIYVAGSARVLGEKCERVEFDIKNVSSNNIRLTWAIFYWSTPNAFYDKISFGKHEVFESDANRPGAGDQASFKKSTVVQRGKVVTVTVEKFWARDQGDSGGNVGMGSVNFSVEFSDGSVLAFTTPPCSDDDG